MIVRTYLRNRLTDFDVVIVFWWKLINMLYLLYIIWLTNKKVIVVLNITALLTYTRTELQAKSSYKYKSSVFFWISVFNFIKLVIISDRVPDAYTLYSFQLFKNSNQILCLHIRYFIKYSEWFFLWTRNFFMYENIFQESLRVMNKLLTKVGV